MSESSRPFSCQSRHPATRVSGGTAAQFAVLIVLAISVTGCIAVSKHAQSAKRPIPFLEIEKPEYSNDEVVRFWIGESSDSDIPEALRNSGVVHIILPGGERKDQRVAKPMDGDSSRGWKGGWGLGPGPPKLGHYAVSFEFAGVRTAEQTFDVVPNPFAQGISAGWTFFNAKSGGDVHTRGAVLHVDNKTGRVMRFAEPGLSGSEVSLEIEQFRPASKDFRFVSPTALLRAAEIPAFSVDRLDWNNQTKLPMITVPGGASVDRSLTLQSSYPFQDGVEYEVTISSVLTVFIGESGDAGSRLFPLRLPISATSRFRW